MFWFDLLFPPAMILFPAVFALCVPKRGFSEADLKASRRLIRWLIGGTVGAILMWLAARMLFKPDVARLGWVLCFPLMTLAQQAIVKRNVDWSPPTARSGAAGSDVRSALLMDRAKRNPVRRGLWGVMWMIWSLAVAGVAMRPALMPIESRAEWTRWGIALGCLIVVSLPLMLFLPALVRASLREAEPMDPGGSAELARAYEQLRNFRAWVFFWMFGVFQPVLIGAAMIALAWLPDSVGSGAIAGLIGGGLGAAFGLVGAGFGIYAGIRRARINGLLRRLEQAHASTLSTAAR